MNIELCSTSSEVNALHKNINTVDSVDCVIKGNISLETPVLILSYSGNKNNINYLRIPEFSRSYFITDLIDLTGSRYEARCKVDVLESFKDDILKLNCIIDKQENNSLSNKYYNDGSFIVTEQETVSTYNFNNGFNENGEFILITAGGD